MPRTMLHVAAVCFEDDRSRVLTVRKRGTDAFMLPGGKLEPGETPAEAAVREVREEIGVELALGDLSPLGSWSGPAANEPDTGVTATVFTAPLTRAPAPAREIAESRWIAPGDTGLDAVLAPLLSEYVFPALDAAR
ncbi:NUDIX hydrolase [Nocardiopsis potens]|uniref:NUDIX hydrolase n=1 Tax=Nocardiopsis potens TaxID=1246458 RepID=UPI0019D40C5E|nr:NUDIX domain-containing protein [Nocardiopsis potens]